IMAAAQAGTAMATDGIDFVDKDDARGVFLALFEEVAHAAGTDAYKHFHEVRAGDREEWDVCFASNGAGQKSLARTRGTNEEHSLGNATAQLLELLRILQEVDNFVQLLFGFVDSGYILKRGFFLLGRQQTRAGFAETQRLVAAGLHLPHHENPK